jgi:hypothetical protein
MRRCDLFVCLAGAASLTHGVMPERRAMAAGLGFAWTKVPAILAHHIAVPAVTLLPMRVVVHSAAIQDRVGNRRPAAPRHWCC